MDGTGIKARLFFGAFWPIFSGKLAVSFRCRVQGVIQCKGWKMLLLSFQELKSPKTHTYLRILTPGDGCFNIFGMSTPKIGEDEPILTNMFQLGWNHQLEMFPLTFGVSVSYHPGPISESNPIGCEAGDWYWEGLVFFLQVFCLNFTSGETKLDV